MGEIIKLPKEWENWPACLQTSNSQIANIVRVVQGFGREYIGNVLVKYSNAVGIDKSVRQKAPTFHDVTGMYGRKATLFWLRLQLYKTFEFIGILDSVSENQIREVSNLIITHEIFGQLTLSEFQCFLRRFKEGRYEKIYSTNHPNMQEFMKCLPEFWNDLIQARRRADDEARRVAKEKDKNNPDLMTKEEWEEIKMLTKMYEMVW